MKPRKIKARRMWASQPKGMSMEVYHTKFEAENFGDYPGEAFRVDVIWVDEPEKLVAQAVLALRDAHFARGGEIGQYWHDDARAVLESLNIIPRKAKAK